MHYISFVVSCYSLGPALPIIPIDPTCQYRILLSWSESPKMLPHSCRILQKYTTFEVSDMHPMTFLKSLSNIGILYHIQTS